MATPLICLKVSPENVKQLSVKTSSAKRSIVSVEGSLTVRWSKKYLSAKSPSLYGITVRRVKRKAHFHDKEQPSDEPQRDEFESLKPKKSNWTPPDGQFTSVDLFVKKCRVDIQKLNFNKSLKFSNLSKEEWTAHQNLKTRDDIVIKPADKGGAVVVWRTDLYKQEAFRQLADTKFYAKVNKDLTQANQKIVKDTVNKLILQQKLPSTARNLFVTTPKHLHFTSNRKSTNLTTPVARSFLPAVAQQNSFPAF